MHIHILTHNLRRIQNYVYIRLTILDCNYACKHKFSLTAKPKAPPKPTKPVLKAAVVEKTIAKNAAPKKKSPAKVCVWEYLI